MVIGACAGSTGGGIKVSRLLILFKSARAELRRLLHPHRVEVMTMDGKRVSSDVIRGYNDTIILYLLLDKPSYGYEISKQIKQISEEKYVIKETTLYSAFTRLEKNGYITSFSSSDNANGKRRTYYQITGSGREYYRMKCEEWKLTLDVVSKFIRF